MLTPRRENPNVETAHLLKKYLKAQRIRPLLEIDSSYEKKRGVVAKPTKYKLRTLDRRVYVYFDDGSLRRLEAIVGNKPVFRTRGKAAVKAAKRRRMVKAGLITNKVY